MHSSVPRYRLLLAATVLSCWSLTACTPAIAQDAGTAEGLDAQWAELEGDWICYRGNGFTIKRISRDEETYEMFLRDGSQLNTSTNRMELSQNDDDVNVFTKYREDGSVVYRGIYKVRQDVLYEVAKTFRADTKNQIPKVFESRRLDAPIEQWLAAAREGDTEKLSEMLDGGFDINATAPDSPTALTAASSTGNTETVAFLLEHGAKLDEPSMWWDTFPILEAAAFGHIDTVTFLLSHGSTLETTHNFGMNSLHEAAFWNQPEMAAFLIERGADLEAKNRWDATPLHIAILRGQDPNSDEASRLPLISVLLEHGASRTAKTDQGETALDIAQRLEMDSVVKLLSNDPPR
jgi:ankyrin repeat protein